MPRRRWRSQWLREGRRFVQALLIEVEGSAPLPEGAMMVVDEHGNIEGSITGGCVEGAVVTEAEAIMAGERGPGVLTYGISDELAGTVGLMCGGIVHIFISEPTGAGRADRAGRARGARRGPSGGDRHAARRRAGRRTAGRHRGDRHRLAARSRRCLIATSRARRRDCSRRARRPFAASAPTAPRSATSSASTSAPTRCRRRCSSSARSTSRPRWRRSPRRSATR